VATFRERNDRKNRGEQGFSKGRGEPRERGGDPQKSHGGEAARGGGRPPFRGKREDGSGWLWGRHAVEAALLNSARKGDMRLVALRDRARELEQVLAQAGRALRIEFVEPNDLARLLPQGAVHQGVALRPPPLEDVTVEELGEEAKGVLLMLDQVTDPQNVGAILRSAAAFGARGVILQDRNAPQLGGALAKAAAGAVDKVPVARVTNLSRALEKLSDLGWRSVGLAGEADQTLEEALDSRPTVLVLGSEGEGLRRLVSEHCEALARIPMPGGFESLNVSNAAAVALYECSRKVDRG